MARGFGIPVTPIDEAFPVFLHGPVGAEVLKRDFGLDDEEALDAVRYHTMGRAGMTPLEQVLFLADKLDPSKVARYPFLPEVEAAAHHDLDEGMRLFIDRQAAAFLEHGDLVHPGMIDARNDALLLKARAEVGLAAASAGPEQQAEHDEAEHEAGKDGERGAEAGNPQRSLHRDDHRHHHPEGDDEAEDASHSRDTDEEEEHPRRGGESNRADERGRQPRALVLRRGHDAEHVAADRLAEARRRASQPAPRGPRRCSPRCRPAR